MRSELATAILAGALALGAVACSPPAPVIQGTVLETNEARLVVRDEERAATAPLVLDVATADVGRTPRVGDRVRIVYREADGVNRALAVMNLTRQEATSPGRH